MIFVNLSVKDIAAARSFFTGLGFRFDPDYSDDQAACLVVDRNIFVMLLAEDRFRAFVPGEVAGRGTTEVLTSLSVDSREEVDRIVARRWPAAGDRGSRRCRTARCTATASRTPTATSGSWCTSRRQPGTPRRCRHR
jgi:uncharacterized protein